jgi:sulfate transport system substrate-binding protein
VIAGVLAIATLSAGCGGNSTGSTGSAGSSVFELLNVSYDPTRELWRDINSQFVPQYEREHQATVSINQSHGGSGTQARAVIDGLDADVVTLALWLDTDAVRKEGLISSGWEEKFPNRSLPYSSTIVFVVRKGNPRGIRDWPDLVKGDVEIITPNPKTSGNGKLSFLAAWGSVIQRGGTEADARKFVTELYRHTKVLDTGARGATSTFAQKGIGDVHLTWENEAHLEVREAAGELELVYPPVSIRAEPHVAVVDQNVDRKGTRAVAEAYLNYLYTDEAQGTIARHFYRPSNEQVLAKHAETFRPIVLFPITVTAEGWDAAQKKFFAEGAIFDGIYQPGEAASNASR